MAARTPHMMVQPGTNRRLTLLDCGVCGAMGHFVITLVTLPSGERRFAGPCCVERVGV